MIWFTADHHLGHENILSFCNRPFASVDEMNNALVAAWNKVVAPGDTVYHLGDFTLSYRPAAAAFFSRLNGYINIVAPQFHHDKRWIPAVSDNYNYYSHSSVGDAAVDILESLATLEFNPPIALCHFPVAQWDRRHHGAWHLHGHSHGNYQGEGKILDVGVDNIARIYGEYRPVSLNEVREYMEEREL